MLVLFVTGVLEAFYSIPTPGEAALSIQTLAFPVRFGGLVRNLLHRAAQFLVFVSFVHLLRVIFIGAYLPPHRFNYLPGMELLILVILLDFTGYVQRRDRVFAGRGTGTNLIKTIPLLGPGQYARLVGGSLLGAAILICFNGWHIFRLTRVAAILVAWHMFRVRRDGGIAVPPLFLRDKRLPLSQFAL